MIRSTTSTLATAILAVAGPAVTASDGVYQLNWKSSKDFAGNCRRLRLDLGERNPDGTVFYRTADFRFTR
jgi:hypothetical protein